MKFQRDLRAHPANTFHNSGLKISFSSDDPGLFRLTPQSHDLFAAVVAFPLDLKDVKRIQLNAIDGLLLCEEKKEEHRVVYAGRWKAFIENFLKDQHP